VAVVVGVGPGIGAATAKRFAREGYVVALIARRTEHTSVVEKDIRESGGEAVSFQVDVSSEESVKAGFKSVRGTIGDPQVLVYNAAARRFKTQGINELSAEEFHNFWKINCFGAFLVCQEVVPAMINSNCGTIIFTGATASVRALSGFSSFSVGKFGLRALAQSLAHELGPKGIHIVHVIVDGKVDVPIVRNYVNKYVQSIVDTNANAPISEWMDPRDIADLYWMLHSQPKNVWTFELDLRPYNEKFTAKM